MKPWMNPLTQTTCYLCGQPGWNRDAMDQWHGVLFRCRDGCDPEAVMKYQLQLAIKKAIAEVKGANDAP